MDVAEVNWTGSRNPNPTVPDGDRESLTRLGTQTRDVDSVVLEVVDELQHGTGNQGLARLVLGLAGMHI